MNEYRAAGRWGVGIDVGHDAHPTAANLHGLKHVRSGICFLVDAEKHHQD
ncbi:MAG: hypothetical protein HZB62_06840 [Nitrospirae bacterium]|nr:hypothetical protein [Nitrospirota bacterium]